MHQKNSILAVIPARAGSKGLPNKNLALCAGRPLVEWTINAALGAECIDKVLVSTDSKLIADVAKSAGACVPFLRPKELATDDAGIVDVLIHAWNNCLDDCGAHFDYVVLLQPTSPLRTKLHLTEAVHYYFDARLNEGDSLASVYRANPKNGWLMQLDGDKYVKFCFDVASNNPQRQKLSPYFLPNGAIFIAKGTALSDGLYHKGTIPYEMSKSDSIDIDLVEDLRIAESIILSGNGLAPKLPNLFSWLKKLKHEII